MLPFAAKKFFSRETVLENSALLTDIQYHMFHKIPLMPHFLKWLESYFLL